MATIPLTSSAAATLNSVAHSYAKDRKARAHLALAGVAFPSHTLPFAALRAAWHIRLRHATLLSGTVHLDIRVCGRRRAQMRRRTVVAVAFARSGLPRSATADHQACRDLQSCSPGHPQCVHRHPRVSYSTTPARGALQCRSEAWRMFDSRSSADSSLLSSV